MASRNLSNSCTMEVDILNDSQKLELEALTGESEFNFFYFSLFLSGKGESLQNASFICKFCNGYEKLPINSYKSHQESQDHLKKLVDNVGKKGVNTMIAEIKKDDMSFLDFDNESQQYSCSLCKVVFACYKVHCQSCQHVKMLFIREIYSKLNNDEIFIWEKYWFYIEFIESNTLYCAVCQSVIDFKSKNPLSHLRSPKHQKKCNLFGSFADFYENLRFLTFNENGKGDCSLCSASELELCMEDMESLWRHFLYPPHVSFLNKTFDKMEGKNLELMKLLEKRDSDYSFSSNAADISGTQLSVNASAANGNSDVASETQECMIAGTPNLNNLNSTVNGTKETEESIATQPSENTESNIGNVANEAQENKASEISSGNIVKKIAEVVAKKKSKNAAKKERKKAAEKPTGEIVKDVGSVEVEQFCDFYSKLADEDKLVWEKNWFFAKIKGEIRTRQRYCIACEMIFSDNFFSKPKIFLQHLKGEEHEENCKKYGARLEFGNNVKALTFYPALNQAYCKLCKIILSDCSRENVRSLWYHFLSSKHNKFLKAHFYIIKRENSELLKTTNNQMDKSKKCKPASQNTNLTLGSNSVDFSHNSNQVLTKNDSTQNTSFAGVNQNDEMNSSPKQKAKSSFKKTEFSSNEVLIECEPAQNISCIEKNQNYEVDDSLTRKSFIKTDFSLIDNHSSNTKSYETLVLLRSYLESYKKTNFKKDKDLQNSPLESELSQNEDLRKDEPNEKIEAEILKPLWLRRREQFKETGELNVGPLTSEEEAEHYRPDVIRYQKLYANLGDYFKFIWEQYWFFIQLKRNAMYCVVCRISSSTSCKPQKLLNHFRELSHEKKCFLYGSFASFYENLKLLTFSKNGGGYCSLCKITESKLDMNDTKSLWHHFLSAPHYDLLKKQFTEMKEENIALLKDFGKVDPDYGYDIPSINVPKDVEETYSSAVKYDDVLQTPYVKHFCDFYSQLDFSNKILWKKNWFYMLSEDHEQSQTFCKACQCFVPGSIFNDPKPLFDHLSGKKHLKTCSVFGDFAHLMKNATFIKGFEAKIWYQDERKRQEERDKNIMFCSFCKVLDKCNKARDVSVWNHIFSTNHCKLLEQEFVKIKESISKTLSLPEPRNLKKEKKINNKPSNENQKEHEKNLVEKGQSQAVSFVKSLENNKVLNLSTHESINTSTLRLQESWNQKYSILKIMDPEQIFNKESSIDLLTSQNGPLENKLGCQMTTTQFLSNPASIAENSKTSSMETSEELILQNLKCNVAPRNDKLFIVSKDNCGPSSCSDEILIEQDFSQSTLLFLFQSDTTDNSSTQENMSVLTLQETLALLENQSQLCSHLFVCMNTEENNVEKNLEASSKPHIFLTPQEKEQQSENESHEQMHQHSNCDLLFENNDSITKSDDSGNSVHCSNKITTQNDVEENSLTTERMNTSPLNVQDSHRSLHENEFANLEQNNLENGPSENKSEVAQAPIILPIVKKKRTRHRKKSEVQNHQDSVCNLPPDSYASILKSDVCAKPLHQSDEVISQNDPSGNSSTRENINTSPFNFQESQKSLDELEFSNIEQINLENGSSENKPEVAKILILLPKVKKKRTRHRKKSKVQKHQNSICTLLLESNVSIHQSDDCSKSVNYSDEVIIQNDVVDKTPSTENICAWTLNSQESQECSNQFELINEEQNNLYTCLLENNLQEPVENEDFPQTPLIKRFCDIYSQLDPSLKDLWKENWFYVMIDENEETRTFCKTCECNVSGSIFKSSKELFKHLLGKKHKKTCQAFGNFAHFTKNVTFMKSFSEDTHLAQKEENNIMFCSLCSVSIRCEYVARDFSVWNHILSAKHCDSLERIFMKIKGTDSILLSLLENKTLNLRILLKKDLKNKINDESLFDKQKPKELELTNEVQYNADNNTENNLLCAIEDTHSHISLPAVVKRKKKKSKKKSKKQIHQSTNSDESILNFGNIVDLTLNCEDETKNVLSVTCNDFDEKKNKNAGASCNTASSPSNSVKKKRKSAHLIHNLEKLLDFYSKLTLPDKIFWEKYWFYVVMKKEVDFEFMTVCSACDEPITWSNINNSDELFKHFRTCSHREQCDSLGFFAHFYKNTVFLELFTDGLICQLCNEYVRHESNGPKVVRENYLWSHFLSYKHCQILTEILNKKKVGEPYVSNVFYNFPAQFLELEHTFYEFNGANCPIKHLLSKCDSYVCVLCDTTLSSTDNSHVKHVSSFEHIETLSLASEMLFSPSSAKLKASHYNEAFFNQVNKFVQNYPRNSVITDTFCLHHTGIKPVSYETDVEKDYFSCIICDVVLNYECISSHILTNEHQEKLELGKRKLESLLKNISDVTKVIDQKENSEDSSASNSIFLNPLLMVGTAIISSYLFFKNR